MADAAAPLLEVRDLEMTFGTRGGLRRTGGAEVRAVSSVSLDLQRGEALGLVGESGCGKTTLGRTLLRLYEPTAGTIRFDGTDITHLPERRIRPIRRSMQMVYQDPFASLNPRLRVQEIVAEPLVVHGIGDAASRRDRVRELLTLVGLSPEHAARYPHQFSGGQRQRIGIARAIAPGPKLIVCDEAVSALDVSVQAQVLNLLAELRHELDLTLVFISHDLGVVRHLCDRVAVMYLGRIVETAPTEELFEAPVHPYTQALLSAVPVPDPDVEVERPRVVLSGDVPSPMAIPAGCPFHTRCPLRDDGCDRDRPALEPVRRGHEVACLRVDAAVSWRAGRELERA